MTMLHSGLNPVEYSYEYNATLTHTSQEQAIPFSEHLEEEDDGIHGLRRNYEIAAFEKFLAHPGIRAAHVVHVGGIVFIADSSEISRRGDDVV